MGHSRSPAQLSLLSEAADRTLLAPLGAQADIRYFAATARSVLNSPAATGMPFWSINPFVGCAFGCQYCYARYAHRYVSERSGDASPLRGELPPWLAFERRILVKRDAAALLMVALQSEGRLAGLRDAGVVIGTATDPYQPAERQFRVTRDVLEVLARQVGLRITIITRSPLVTRDEDVLLRIAERSRLSVHVSLITVDRELARRLEPRAPTPEARLRAIARLRRAGIVVVANVMPVLPKITDSASQMEALVTALKAADVSYAGMSTLRLRATARAQYLPFIEREFPALASRYRRAYATGYQVREDYRSAVRERFTALCERVGVTYGYLVNDAAAVSGGAGGDVAQQMVLGV